MEEEERKAKCLLTQNKINVLTKILKLLQKFNDKNSNWKRGKRHKFTPDKNNFIGQPDEDFKKKNASTFFVINRNRSTDRLKGEKDKLISTDALKYLIIQKPFLMKQRNKPW